MEQILILSLISVAGLILVTVILNLEKWYRPDIGYPYEPRSYLYDTVERRFLGHLVQAIGRDFLIFGKVRVADIVRIKSDTKPGIRKLAWDRIAKEHIDFLLCDKVGTRIICAVELYEPRKNPVYQIKRARMLDQVFNAAGIPLVRFPRAQQYKTLEIESSLAQVFENFGIHIGPERFVSKRNKRAKSTSLKKFGE